MEAYSEENDPELQRILREVDRGHRIAQELVEHVAGMKAGGLVLEVGRDGEIWNVEVKFLGRMSDVKKLVEPEE
jgi:hypothetical protein